MILTPEIWDPATQVFRQMKPMQTPRVYHSTGILLPDGRVFAGAGVEFDQSDHDRRVESARAGLGEAGFAAAWSEGRAMTLEQATDDALAALDAAPSKVQETERPEGDTGTDLLTTREREVAALVAHGLTNRQIAARLVITERTAETHVQNILNKLGFTSRAQVAARAVQRGLRLPTKE